jgi:protein-S-isoprenylcysteine O-methyltransferase Ste14
MAIQAIRDVVLFVETILFTVLVPGTVAVWIPYRIVLQTRLGMPALTVASSLAIVVAALGTATYFRCLWDFAVTGRGIPAPIDHPKRLVVRGLYRYVRNPMYLGVLLILLGETLFFGSSALLMYTVGWFALVHIVVVLYEEPNLRRKFGPSYVSYISAVGRWIPGRKYGMTA